MWTETVVRCPVKITVLVNAHTQDSGQNILCFRIQETIENEKREDLDIELSLVSIDDTNAFSDIELISSIYILTNLFFCLVNLLLILGINRMSGEMEMVYRTDDVIRISIRDNGIGMSAETIDKILSGTYRETELAADSNGIGMDNVIARLKLFTESEDVMTIISESENQGTEFIIYLPNREREEDNV